MAEEQSTAERIGASIGMSIKWYCNILFLIFVTLKVTELVDWSWWVVFIPTFVRFGIFFLCLLVLGTFTFVRHQKK